MKNLYKTLNHPTKYRNVYYEITEDQIDKLESLIASGYKIDRVSNRVCSGHIIVVATKPAEEILIDMNFRGFKKTNH